MKVIAVVPALNEGSRLRAVLASLKPYVAEIVVVDDGSRDQTAEIARSEKAHVVSHRMNRGQGAALKTGMHVALERGADVVVHLDADGQHDPETLLALLMPLQKGELDVVYGSRFLGVAPEGMPTSRRYLLHAARIFSAYCLGIPRTVTDPQSGLRAMRGTVARELVFAQDGMAHCSEILRWVTRSRFRWGEVPIRVRYTDESLQKGQKAHHAVKIVWELLLGSF